jgi:hypothetical protein
MTGFTKLFPTMWAGSLYGRFEASAVFMVLLSLSNRQGVVDMTPEAIAGQTGWPIDTIKKGLAELAAPDPRSRTPDCEGRRITPLDDHRDWGWRITNYAKYREAMRSFERREYLADKQREHRQSTKRQHLSTPVNTVNHDQPIAEAKAKAITPSSLRSDGESATLSPTPGQPPEGSKTETQNPPLACPHLELLALWKEVLPALPQHDPDLWDGARADHLRTRWRETAARKRWHSKAEGLTYFRKLFEYIGESHFLCGRTHQKGRRPFLIELAWLVRAANWAAVHEGRYANDEGGAA